MGVRISEIDVVSLKQTYAQLERAFEVMGGFVRQLSVLKKYDSVVVLDSRKRAILRYQQAQLNEYPVSENNGYRPHFPPVLELVFRVPETESSKCARYEVFDHAAVRSIETNACNGTKVTIAQVLRELQEKGYPEYDRAYRAVIQIAERFDKQIHEQMVMICFKDNWASQYYGLTQLRLRRNRQLKNGWAVPSIIFYCGLTAIPLSRVERLSVDG